MKKILAILPFLLTLYSITAQSEWNFISSFPYPPNQRITDMLVDDDENIVIYGLGFNDTMEWRQGILVAKMDTNGVILNTNLILDALGDDISIGMDWGKIIKTSDGGYAATAAPLISNSAFLIKLSHDLEVEFIREYPDTVNRSNFDYNLIEVTGGYLLFGSIQKPDYYLDGFVKHVDESGETLWELNFANTLYDNRVLDIGQINDSTFVCVTVEGITPFSFFEVESGRSGIYFIDLQGNITDAWQSEAEPQIGYLRKVIPLEDGSFITYGLAHKGLVNTTHLVRSTLTKFDPSFSINWVHEFGTIIHSFSHNRMYDFCETVDGHFVGAGNKAIKIGDEPTKGNGWLYKFSAEGDSIWARHFPTPFPDVFPYTGTLYGVGTLASGSIIAGGTATDEQYNYCWIVKMTNEGCMDTLFCQITSTAEPSQPSAGLALRAWPNPAHDFLNLAYREIPQALQLRLIDLRGRVVHEKELAVFSTQAMIDTSAFPAGIYFLEIQSDGRLLERLKVVVAH